MEPSFAELISTFTDLEIVIEHLGNVNQPEGGEPPTQAVERIFGLARFPNVSIKIHGLGEFNERDASLPYGFPFRRPLPGLLEAAYSHFGPDRMMWGSDFPPVSGREGYRNALQWTMDELSDKPPSEREQIFGGVAERIFNGSR